MSELFLLTNAAEPPVEIMPALGLLLHTVRTGPADMIAFEDASAADAILVDARRDLISARQLCQLLRRAAPQALLLAVLTEGGLAAVTAEWGTDDVMLASAGPAEIEARLRLAIGRQVSAVPVAPDRDPHGELSIDEATYTARLRARVLDLTFKEFELLKFLAQHPGRVFSRAHLLQEVWGYDYFGGTRTVDVHVRRLRAKLGPEHEALIGTVRNVGYRFVPLKAAEDGRRGRRARDSRGGAAAQPPDAGGELAAAANRRHRPRPGARQLTRGLSPATSQTPTTSPSSPGTSSAAPRRARCSASPTRPPPPTASARCPNRSGCIWSMAATTPPGTCWCAAVMPWRATPTSAGRTRPGTSAGNWSSTRRTPARAGPGPGTGGGGGGRPAAGADLGAWGPARAAGLAAAAGFARVRSLFQMRRSLAGAVAGATAARRDHPAQLRARPGRGRVAGAERGGLLRAPRAGRLDPD